MDLPLKKCPECNGKIRRLVSGGSGLIFKGSGFYLTDYAKRIQMTKKQKSQRKQKRRKPQKKVQNHECCDSR